MARVDCLIRRSPSTPGIRQLLNRPRRKSPHPDTKNRKDDDKPPTRAERDDLTSYLNREMIDETNDVDNRNECENGRRNPQASSL
jgi:hypothetical protein